MLISDYVQTHYLAERPGLSAAYRSLMAATARKLCAFAGRPLTLSECDRALLSSWASQLLQTARPATVNDKLRMVRTVLVAAYDDGLLDRPPRKVRAIPEALPPPEAWTLDECRALFLFLSRLSGTVGDCPAASWWTSLVLVSYWTGCRIGALMRSTPSDYQRGVGLVVRRQKNGRQQWYRLPLSCCERVDLVLPSAGRIWAWPYHNRTLWRQFRRIVERTGIPCPRTGRNLFYRLRRTNASYCAAEDPAIAQRQLDHADLSTTRRYIDPRIARQRSAVDILPDPLPVTILRVIG